MRGSEAADKSFIEKMMAKHDAAASWVPFSDEERSWWELATVLCLERALGRTSAFYEYIHYCLPQKPVDWAAAFFHQREQLFAPSSGLPADSVARLSRISSNREMISFWIARLLRACVLHNGSKGGPRNDQHDSDSGSVTGHTIVSQCSVATQIQVQGLHTAMESVPLEDLTGWLHWSYEVVTSRANNFVLTVPYTTETPRPYGVDLSSVFASMMQSSASGGAAAPPPLEGVSPALFSYDGAEATLCPIFDLMNHLQSSTAAVGTSSTTGGGGMTNVLVTDCLMRPPPRRSSHDIVQDENPIPCLVLGALGNITKGMEIGYAYNAPTILGSDQPSKSLKSRTPEQIVAERLRAAEGGRGNKKTIDIIESLARWGFVPFP